MGKRRLPYDTTDVSLEELDIGSSDFGLDPDRFCDERESDLDRRDRASFLRIVGNLVRGMGRTARLRAGGR
jgi:hypothetical protein